MADDVTRQDETLADPGRSRAALTRDVESLERGARLGRYVVLELIGGGGMGVVYKAYDPELDRRVAIKLLRGTSSQSRVRLVREAQALAKLSHPNVVAVFDVGNTGRDVFVAMELVEGTTLRGWLAQTGRSRREIIELFLEAGRGLAAAHRAGLVHRDFKPENVLIAADGRARVADFGIARALDCDPADDDGIALDRDSIETGGRELRTPATRTGSRIGTPAYMAPEQFRGGEVDDRADQFAFCVSLYEALYGQRPFSGHTAEELESNVSREQLRDPPATTAVPSWLRGALVRGLRADPADRFESMEALLHELAVDPATSRRRWLAVAAVAGLAALAAVGLLRGAGSPEPPCRGAAGRLATVWNPEAKRAVERAFAATERQYAADTYQRVATILDDYAAAWVAMRTDACAATRVRGEQSERLLDLRMSCLDRRLAALEALVKGLANGPTTEVLGRAINASHKLSGLSACADAHSLDAAYPPPEDPAVRNEIETLYARLAEAVVSKDLGNYDESLRQVEPIAKRAEELDYPPLLSEALFHRGDALSKSGRHEPAEASLRAAGDAAARASANALLASVWIHLTYVVGVGLTRHEEALGYRAYVDNLLTLADAPVALRSGYRSNLGAVLYESGRYQEARDEYERAIALAEDSPTPDSDALARTLTNLGLLLEQQGQHQEARQRLERAVELMEKTLGPGHPNRAIALNNLGLTRQSLGELDQALELYQEALSIALAAHGPDHPDVGGGYNNVGDILVARGDLAGAREGYQKALATWERTLGPAHPVTGIAVVNLGKVALASHDYAQALAQCERALTLFEGALGSDHPNLAYPLTCLGEAQLGQRRPQQALGPLERAERLRSAAPGDTAELAETRFALARALWESKRNRARALELAEAAHAAFAHAGERRRAEATRVEGWLRAHAAR